MFGKKAVPKEYVPYEKYSNANFNVEVKEQKAPTDESIKFYHEMREKIFKEILESIQIKSNIFNAKAFFISNMHHIIMVYSFHLNGVEITGEVKLHEIDFRINKEKGIQEIFEKLSTEIGGKLMEVALSDKNSLRVLGVK